MTQAATLMKKQVVLDALAGEPCPATGRHLMLFMQKGLREPAVRFSWKTAAGVSVCRLLSVDSGMQRDHARPWLFYLAERSI